MERVSSMPFPMRLGTNQPILTKLKAATAFFLAVTDQVLSNSGREF
jgi:hypothetical protein